MPTPEGEYSVADALKDRERLRERKDLWENPAFVHWREEVQKDLDLIKEHGIVVSDRPGRLQRILNECGLNPPMTQEEQLRVYLALRAVVHFWARKLGSLEAESGRFKELSQQLEEQERSGNL